MTFVLIASSAVLLAEPQPVGRVIPNAPDGGLRISRPTKVERRKPLTANVGVVSVGLDTYWKQCPGLYEDMLKKAAVFEKGVAAHQVKVTSFGISDNPEKEIGRAHV